ncbi:MAG: NAD-dependent protein deacetylase [Longimicrobiales bacterium]
MPATPSDPATIDALASFLHGRRVAVLTGAGCSTDSGIPDYRGPDGTLRTREPMRYQVFMGSDEARRRYWSRSMVGWRRFRQARPNDAHRALAAMERAGLLSGVITQNVDGLHQAAGSRTVVDLHGTLDRVRCTACSAAVSRDAMQSRLEAANRPLTAAPSRYVADGDAEIPDAAAEGFVVPGCADCGGILKPDVVFFGESVPKPWVEDAWRTYEAGDALLVVGSSLTVFSGRRFVLRATREGKPVAVVNLGRTRADDEVALKVDAPVGVALPGVAAALGAA